MSDRILKQSTKESINVIDVTKQWKGVRYLLPDGIYANYCPKEADEDGKLHYIAHSFCPACKKYSLRCDGIKNEYHCWNCLISGDGESLRKLSLTWLSH